VTQKYRRRRAALATSLSFGLLAALALGGGTALAVDPPAAPPADVLLDGVVTVHHVDSVDGPVAGATITVSSYRDPALPIQVLTATTDDAGLAVVEGIARPMDGAPAVHLDVRSDLVVSVVNGDGCTETSSWLAAVTLVPSAAAVEIDLDSTAKSLEIECPEPPEPTEPPAEPVDPAPTAEPSSGAVLGATGQPQVTPPATDTGGDDSPSAGPSPAVAGMIAVLVLFSGAVAAEVRRRAVSRRGS
jgi:hypothetical protein